MTTRALQKLVLDRPVAFFDIESTGINKKNDRIIDLAIIKVHPDHHTETHTFRVHPGMPIPPESTKVHGITDDDVKGAPSFAEVAKKVEEALEGCDLAGYNILGFDIPMLQEEFQRAGIAFDPKERRVLDVQRIFHKREPRDLTAALAFYCGEMHMDAHGAMGDVLATIRVAEGQLDHYRDLPHSMAALSDYCDPRDPSWLDHTGKFRWVDGEAVLNFSRKQGERLRDVAANDPGFLRWMLRGDFAPDARAIAQDALGKKFPSPDTDGKG